MSTLLTQWPEKIKAALRPRLSRPNALVRSWALLIRRLPGRLPFLPLIWHAWLQPAPTPRSAAQAAGSLTPAEREWLTKQARRLSESGVIVQAGLTEADVTCALAEGCWATRRRVMVLWPKEPAGQQFRQWQQTIIRHGLAPYVTPIIADGGAPSAIDMLYADAVDGWIERLRPGALVVRRRSPASPELMHDPMEVCGTLVAIRVNHKKVS